MRGPLAPAPIGHNAPPAATPFEAVAVHLDDLLTEARAWADGTPVATQAQADELSFLIDQLRKGGQAAEKLRKAEKQPHLDAAKAVDERFRPLTDAADRAITATKRTMCAWLEALATKQRAEAARTAASAEAASRQAAMARALADAADLESQEAAAETTARAEELAKGARRAESATASANGGARAMTLRSYWSASRIVDRRETLRYYLAATPDDVEAALLEMARRDVARGVRAIPGVEIIEDRRPV